jgi:vacuolar protein sorting-associated protein 1
VITKIDIMDKGTDARVMLENEEIHLKLGYYGVKNRSQADVDAKKSIEDMRRDEMEFFTTHPVYGGMNQSVMGIESLTNKLTITLFEQIREQLPKILGEIKTRWNKAEEELKDLGVKVPEDLAAKQNLLWQLISEYCKNIEK